MSERSLRERLGIALAERFGALGLTWEERSEMYREEWRKEADMFIKRAIGLRIVIADQDQGPEK